MTKVAKIMPHNTEAEQALLGCLLIDENVPVQVMSNLKKEDFYLDAHANIFDAMDGIYNSNKPVDFITVSDDLDKRGVLESVGGLEYLATLTNVVPSAVNYSHYLEIVKRDSVMRKLIASGQKIIESAYKSENKTDALSFAEKLIFEIAQNEDNSSLEHIGPALKNVIERFDKIAKDGGTLRGVATGFKDLDRATNGLQNSDLILLAARPGVGKTSLAMNIITHASVNEGKRCAIFSLEMPNTQLAQRAVCSLANVSMGKALKGQLNVEDWKAIWAANKKLNESGLYVDDSSMNTPIDVLSKCRRLKREGGLDLVMIDYLQLMNSGGRAKDNRQQEISEITRYLKIAARELNVPIILLSQLSRAVETRKGDHRPVLSDLRESGSIEQDADIVMFIYKPDMYNDVISEHGPGVSELMIAKHRNGSLENIKLRWFGETTSFKDFDYNQAPVKNTEEKAQVLEVDEDFDNFE
jgi:replicative DNA helicase